jgi:hypothetical protein
MPARAGEQLGTLAIEAAFTAAHFAPHRVRISRNAAASACHAPRLSSIEAALSQVPLGTIDRETADFRVELMRAYEERRPLRWSKPTTSPYAQACLEIENRRNQESQATGSRFSEDSPGIVMLIDRLRRFQQLE